MTAAGAPIDPDLNKFDLEHVVCDHPRMSPGGMAGRLSSGLADLLHRRAHEDGDPPRRGRRPARRHGRLPDGRRSGRRARSTTSTRSRPGSCAASTGSTAGRACRSRTRSSSIRARRRGSSRTTPRSRPSSRKSGGSCAACSSDPNAKSLHRRGAADGRRLRPSGAVPALRLRPRRRRQGEADRRARPRRRGGRGGVVRARPATRLIIHAKFPGTLRVARR